jgi:hypothetical protein
MDLPHVSRHSETEAEKRRKERKILKKKLARKRRAVIFD